MGGGFAPPAPAGAVNGSNKDWAVTRGWPRNSFGVSPLTA